MQRALLLLLAATFLAAAPSPRTALAQDDWGVKRDPFDKRIIARYKKILAKDPNDKRAFRKLVGLYRKHRSLDKLVAEYEAAYGNKRTFDRAMMLGHLYLERGDVPEALAKYEEAAGMSKNDPDVHIARGDLYKRSGKTDEARAAYADALKHAKQSDKTLRKQILRALADLALGADDIKAARKHFEDYIALDPKNAQLRVELADALSQHKRYKDAIDALVEAEKRLKSDPQLRVEVIARIGAAREKLGEDDVAIREYRRAMKLMKRDYHLRRELTERVIEIHRRRQDLPALITHYEKDWNKSSRGHLEWDVLARLYEEIGNQEKAIDAFRAAVKKAPYELDTQRRLISLLENSGQEDAALKQYEAVIKVAPGEPRFQLELAQRYWNRGQAKKALAMLKKVETRFPFDAGVQVALADMYSQWGKEAEALKVYARLTKIEPSEVEHLVNLGEQYYQRGQKDKAIATWKKIAARRTAQGFARLGDVYAEHDMLAEAEAMYTKAIKADPKNPARYRGRARVYQRRKEYSNAVADWEKSLELTGTKGSDRPARREARKRIVTLLRLWSRTEATNRKNAWEQRFRATPPDIEAGYFLVEYYAAQRTSTATEAARRILETILKADPEDKEAMQELVKVYRDANNLDEAIALLEKLAAISPGRERELYNEIAEIKALQQKDGEAIKYSEMAIAKSPNDPIAHEQLAKTYEKMQKFDKAIESYKKTLELNARNFRVYFRLATLYIRKGKKIEAAELYRQVLRKATDEQVLQRAGRKAIDLEEYMDTLGELERIVSPLAFTFSHKPIYRSVLVELYDRYVPRLVAQTRHPDPKVAKAAEAELERLGQHGLKPLLEALADEEDPTQQRIAVSVLGHIGNKGAAVPLVRLAKDTKQPATPRGLSGHARIGTLVRTVDVDVRVDALVAAGRLSDPRVIPSLVELLDHPEKSMRNAAAFALGMTGDRAAAKPLLEALDSGTPSVQMHACFGLARIGDKKHRKAIQDVVRNRRAHRHARAACAFALGYVADPASTDVLLETLEDGNERVQRVAAWSLGRIANDKALPGLLAAYFNKGQDVREAVAWAIPRVARGKRDTSSIAALSDYPVKGGRYDEAAALDGLLGALDTPKLSADLVVGHEQAIAKGIRGALAAQHTNRILRALTDLGARDSGLGLGPLTRGVGAKPDKRVAAALARIADDVFPDLERLATGHRDPEVRAGALGVVARIGTNRAEKVLRAGLADERSSVRIAAVQAAAQYARVHGGASDGLTQAVAELLTAQKWEERRAAALELRHFGARAPTEALLAALKDEFGYVRQDAASTLGALRRTDAVDALLELTHDELRGVQLAAVEALVAIGDRRAASRRAEIAAGDEDDAVVKAARRFK